MKIFLLYIIIYILYIYIKSKSPAYASSNTTLKRCQEYWSRTTDCSAAKKSPTGSKSEAVELCTHWPDQDESLSLLIWSSWSYRSNAGHLSAWRRASCWDASCLKMTLRRTKDSLNRWQRMKSNGILAEPKRRTWEAPRSCSGQRFLEEGNQLVMMIIW